MNTHEWSPALSLVLLFLFAGLAKVFGLLVFYKELVLALKILHYFRAVPARETGQIHCGIAGFVDDNSDLLHRSVLRSPHSKEQLYLFALFCLNDFPAPKHITALAGHGESSLFLVPLMHTIQPFLIEADAAVVLAENGAELTMSVSQKTNVVRSAIEMISPDNNVSALGSLISVVTEKRRAFGMNFDGIA
jgi:hypothetical protein